MISTASLLPRQGSERAPTQVDGLTPETAGRRAIHRRQSQAVQAASYVLMSALLVIYWYAGTIPAIIPSVYFLSGVGLVSICFVISEAQYSDEFDSYYFGIFQVISHVALQILFLLAAPQIGFLFLSIIFLVFGVGGLRLTSRQVFITWSLTAIGLVPIFLLTGAPIGLPLATPAERLATILSYVLMIGQCAYVGLFGSRMRMLLYERSYELKAAYERIEELAESDELTGASNRRSITRAFCEEVARAGRSGLPCSIALIDRDWFKRINDTYGHPTGDEVLRTFALTVLANIRGMDRFGRYGGEEFLLILPELDNERAVRALDRLRTIIGDVDWSALTPSLGVTMSAGVATLRPHETPDTLLARVDIALYAAKAQGRNRVTGA